MNYNGKIQDCQDILKKYEKRKKESLIIADAYYAIGYEKKAQRIRDCSTFLEFAKYDIGTRKLLNANFCRERLCTTCAWRRSKKYFQHATKIMDELTKMQYKFIFATFTVKNVPGYELQKSIDALMAGWHNLTRQKKYKDIILGAWRALEVTYNKTDETYHPHFHAVFAVPLCYFSAVEMWIDTRQWVDMWRTACGIDYTPICDIRALKRSARGIGKEVAEITKYAVKSADLIVRDSDGSVNMDLTQYLVSTFDYALKGRRLVALSGIFRKVAQLLKLDDVENGDLTSEEALNSDLKYVIERYCWNIGLSQYTHAETLTKEQTAYYEISKNFTRGKIDEK